MKPKYIEAEISKHLKVMPDVHPEILAEYRARLIEMNREVTDPVLMCRPDISWIPRVAYELKKLERRLPGKVSEAIRNMTGRGIDPYHHSILEAMRGVDESMI